MADQENTTGRLAACPACAEKRIHSDAEWEKHSLLPKSLAIERLKAEVDNPTPHGLFDRAHNRHNR